MRTIKFRALCMDKWLYGDLEHNRAKDVTRIHVYDDDGNYLKQKAVDPRTVGQFTGMFDCNSKEIYEGDIVRYYDDIEDELVDGIVEYSADHCSFLVINSNEPIGLTAFWKYEVVGNRYDNPDLLTDKLNKQ